MTAPIRLKPGSQYTWAEAQVDGTNAWNEAAEAKTLQLRHTGIAPYWSLRHPVPSVHGRWMFACSSCGVLVFTDRPDAGGGRCSSCHAKRTAEQRLAQDAKRKIKRQAHSEALAQRTGHCIVCGAEMTTKRTTRKTCSDRCRKRLARGGLSA